MPKTGTAITEITKMKVSKKTRGLCLLSFFMITFNKYMPNKVPIMQKPPTHSPYDMFSSPEMMYVIVEAPVENIIIYIPLAEATFGGTPILNKSGLKIAPPPKPKAPETQPPMKEKPTSFARFEPRRSITPSEIPLPYSLFKFYSR